MHESSRHNYVNRICLTLKSNSSQSTGPLPEGSGKMNWTLNRYTARVEDVLRHSNGSEVLVEGPSFYTTGIGYKLGLYYQHDRSGNRVGVRPLKGVYDSLLKWPFVGEITLTFFDQNVPAVS